jgi:hypothetical protein
VPRLVEAGRSSWFASAVGPPGRCRHARRAGPGTAEATGPKELEYERATWTTISKDARLVTFINVFTVGRRTSDGSSTSSHA